RMGRSGKHRAMGGLMVQGGEADAMICGTIGDCQEHFSVVKAVFGYRGGVHTAGAMNALLLPSGNTFIADTYVNEDPTPEQLAEIAVMAAETVVRFGIEPKSALLSHTHFRSSNCMSHLKMRKTFARVRERTHDTLVDMSG
ncbi:phosphate acyltransferase, partial [Salmonella enterica]|uniref:phosphate acyltransferase n=1 Tax=Salmonella enterica TaxID=28901 RepID=UPI00398C333A